MTFTVTYRAKDGALREGVVEAASRGECFAQMKARGIVPISVKEGARKGRRQDGGSPHGRNELRPSRGDHPGRSGGNPKSAIFNLKSAIILAAVLAAAVGAWWFWPRAEQPKEPAPQKKVAPRPVAQPVKPRAPRPLPVETNAPPAPVPVKIDPNARPEKVGEELNGYIKLPSGRLHKVKGVITNNVAQATRGRYAIFPHHCENEIACYLSLKPGDAIFGTMKYNGRFKEEFIRSLETPIVIEPDDSDEAKELKRNVREAKIQLKAAMDRGEDIEQIMSDTRRELQDLARYKMDMTRMLHELRREKPMSVEELQDAVDAANRMLEAKGIAPMKFGPLVRQKMLIELGKEPR